MSKKNKKDRVTVCMPCKRYVKAYLLANFNSPDDNWDEIVNLSADKELNDQFLNRLKRGDNHLSSRTKGTRYTEMVHIEISWDTFYRHGWMLTQGETLKFNQCLERRVKSMLYSYVSSLHAVGLPVSECINRFRKSTKISEFDWDTDSIRKDLQRHMKLDATIADDFFKKIEKNVWVTLSKSKTITEQGYKTYTGEDEEDKI